jgi:hypothetical protein
MPISAESITANMTSCVGPASACANVLAGRKNNPVWDSCELTSIKTNLQVEGELSIVSVTIGVKNSAKRPAEAFVIPIQPTTVGLALGGAPEPFEMLGLRCDTIQPGAEVQATGRFTVRGKPTALWIGVQL